MIKKCFLILILYLILYNLYNCFGVQVEVPIINSSDLQSSFRWWTMQLQDDRTFWRKWIISLVNEYLWLWIVVVSFFIVVLSWIKLLYSNWEEELKKTNKRLIYWLIWIFIAICSYFFVKSLINIF